jgi:hypothetical protein
MRRRLQLLALVLYLLAGLADGAHRFMAPPTLPGSHTGFLANLAVAFCAGLFWPIDIVARPLLISR